MNRGGCVQAIALLLATACSSTDPSLVVPPPPPPPLTGAGPFLVSNPVAGRLAQLGSATPAALDDVAYVSLPPGTLPGGTLATIRVERTGVVVSAPLVDGGLDPVAIPASVGDTITLTVAHASATPDAYRTTIPAKRPPVIVRTVPPKHKRDVPLNARVMVVFSEPIDAASLTPDNFIMRAASAITPGRLAFTSPHNTTVEFIPDDELAPAENYEFDIMPSVADRDAATLGTRETVDFTTAAAVTGNLRIIVSTPTPEFAPPVVTIRVDESDDRTVAVPSASEVSNLSPGRHTVAIIGLDSHCAVQGGPTRDVVVAAGSEAPVTFVVTCAGPTAAGDLRITLHVTGPEFAPSALTVTIDGSTPHIVVIGTSTTVANLPPGVHVVAIGGLNANCAVDGPASQNVSVVAGTTGDVNWQLTCSLAGARQLAYVRDGHIYLANTDGTGFARLTDPAPLTSYGSPAWSPDGTRIAYTRTVGDTSGPGLPQQDIYLMNANGSGKVGLTIDGRSNNDPTWSPDGRFVAFSSIRNGSQGIFAKSVEPGSGGDTPIAASSGWEAYPNWSPDGRRIVYSSDARASDFLMDLYVVAPDGTNRRELITGPFPWNGVLAYLYHAAWSPNGQQIAYVACEVAVVICFPSSEITIANSDGTGIRVVARSGGSAKPSWSRDGRMVAYSEWACPTCTPSIRFVMVDGTGEGVLVGAGHSATFRP